MWIHFLPLLLLPPLCYYAWVDFIPLHCSEINVFVPVHEDELIWVWLKHEARNPQHKFAKYYEREIKRVGGIELDHPNFTDDKGENGKRWHVFTEVRGKYLLWAPIYNTTYWYKTVMFITPWTNFLAPYQPDFIENNLNIDDMILWGHTTKGPFVILEGNHRWYSWLQRFWRFKFTNVYVGLSDQPYVLHAGTGCTKCLLDQTWKGCACNHTFSR